MKTLNTNEIQHVSGGNTYSTPKECKEGRANGDLTIGEMRECIIETSSGGTYKKD